MESDKSIYYSYKYLPIVVGILTIISALSRHVDMEQLAFNGEQDIWVSVTIVLTGILLVLIPFLYVDKLVVVELTNDEIRIRTGDEVKNVHWTEVKSIKMLPAIYPPLYKMRLKNDAGYFLFNTKRQGMYFLIFVWDWSDMGELIVHKKKYLGI